MIDSMGYIAKQAVKGRLPGRGRFGAKSVGHWGLLHKIYLILAGRGIIAFHIYDIIVKDRIGNLMDTSAIRWIPRIWL